MNEGESNPLCVTFENGSGTSYLLDWDIPNGGRLVMTPRDKALAKALLEFALENVERAETEAAHFAALKGDGE